MQAAARALALAAILAAACGTAFAQSAIRQLESISGGSITRHGGSAESMRSSASQGWDTPGGSGQTNYESLRQRTYEKRKAAREERRSKGNGGMKLSDLVPGWGGGGSAGRTPRQKTERKAISIVDPATGKVLKQKFDADKVQAFGYPDPRHPGSSFIAVGSTSDEGSTLWRFLQSDDKGRYTPTGPACSKVSFYEDGSGRKVLYMEQDSGKVGMLDELGRQKLPAVFSGLAYMGFTVDDVSYYRAGLRDADGAQKVGVVTEDGDSVIPCVYDDIDTKVFGKYGIRVGMEGLQGLYSVEGEEVFPAAFQSLDLCHFYDGGKHRAYYRAWTTDDQGRRYTALYDTHGGQLTDFVPESEGGTLEEKIKPLAGALEEFRIY